jgi:2,4-dienoyl-CoA reductase-like NADH-dependent reductase (Old Yellow Enzyme family)
MASISDQVTFPHGAVMKNRLALAPLTNQQSHADGTLSDDEFRWLTMRAEGGFALTMTCASHVQRQGQGFAGQLGCFSDDHGPGLARLADAIRGHGSLAVVQLHHAGRRSPHELIGTAPVAPFDDPKTGARALTTAEVEQVVEDFVEAAVRCERAGFDGVELHGAHDYLLCEFLSPANERGDRYGGSLENRARSFFEIIEGIRARCRADFHVSVRLSPERFGMRTADVISVFEWLAGSGLVDFIDLSLWDVFKTAIDEEFADRPLLELFTGLDRGATRLGAAGKLYSGADVRRAIDAGVDVASIGRAAITNHDFARRILADPDFSMRALPVTTEVLRREGLGDAFIAYMRQWEGFVAAPADSA